MNRTAMKAMVGVTVALAAIGALAEEPVKASSFGWNAEDATECLQKAINSKAPVIVVDRMPSPWIVTPIRCVSDQKIIFEKGVEVQAKKGAFLGTGDTLFGLYNVRNTTLSGYGAKFRMWKADYLKPPYTRSDYRMSIMIYASENVTIEGLYLLESGGDGLYVGGGPSNWSKDVTIRDVVSDGHFRQGISVTSVDGLLIERSVFRNTSGTAPTAGIDFEPYDRRQRLSRIVLRDCLFENNDCAGIEVAAQGFDVNCTPLDFLIENCRSIGNGTACKFTINNLSGKEVLGRCIFRNCEFEAPQRGLVFCLLKNMKNSCELGFENCRIKDKGDRDFHVLTDAEWKSQVGSDVAVGSDPDVKEIENPSFDGLVVIDEKPGEMVKFTPFEHRYGATYAFYADKAKTVRFLARARTFNETKQPIAGESIVITDLKGRKIAEIPMPIGEYKEVSCEVPAEGFYRLSPKGIGVYGLFALCGSDVPLAREQGSFWHAAGECWFYVEDADKPMIVQTAGGGPAENIWFKLFDPTGKKYYEKASVGVTHRITVEAPRPTGLWHYTVGKPDTGFHEDSSVTLKGIPNWHFVSPRRYWNHRITGCAGIGLGADDLSRLAADEYRHVVRPGWENGGEYWNTNATMFIYPPAFGFRRFPNAEKYEFTVIDDRYRRFSFTAETPNEPLTNVWPKMATGLATVFCNALGKDGESVGFSGSHCFWKGAPFRPGAYPPARCPYTVCAAKIYDYVFNLEPVQNCLRTGRPDPSYNVNAYPSKIHSSLIRGMSRYARAVPEKSQAALKLARILADYLIASSEPKGAPLEAFPPTYEAHREFQKMAAALHQGMLMMLYPASAGTAYLELFHSIREDRYRAAAIAIADRYLALQGEDGTWYLKLYLKDGRPVVPNRCIPTGIGEFLETVYAETGDEKYRRAADRAFAYLERGRLRDWNWEGQFEDAVPSAKYVNLTMHSACNAALYLLRRYHPVDATRLALARELLRFAEDQFVCWERPCRPDGTGIKTGCEATSDYFKWTSDYLKWLDFPSALEQYSWYVPIDASNAKMIDTYLALYGATGNPLDLAKARALGDTLTRVQLASGRLPTELTGYKLENPMTDWINCMLISAQALENLSAVTDAKH